MDMEAAMNRWVLVIVLLLAWVPPVAASPGGVPQAPALSELPPAFVRLDGALKTAVGDARTGIVILVVSLYSGQADPTPVWSEEQTVTLDAAGRYTVLAGASRAEGLPKELFGGNAAQWLGVAVKGEAEQPRVGLVSVPYALKAKEADTLAGKSATDFVLTENLSTSVEKAMAAQTGAKRTTATEDGATTNLVTTTNALVKYTDTGGTTGGSTITESGGVLTVPGFGTHLFSAGGTGSNFIDVRNPTSGPGNNAMVRLSTETVGAMELRALSSTYTSAGNLVQNGASVEATTPGGLSLAAAHASGAIRFFSGGATLRGTMAAAGSFSWLGDFSVGASKFSVAAVTGNTVAAGTLAVNGFGTHTFSAGGTGFHRIDLKNQTPGTGNGAMIRLDTDVAEGLVLRALSSTYLTASGLVASGGLLMNGGSGGLSIMAEHASGAIRFYSGGNAERVRLDPSGNVGIGTTSPGAKLHVAGNVIVDGNIGAKYQDVAEWVERGEIIEPGTVVIVDPVHSNHVTPSTRAFDTRVAGAVSRQPGLVLGEPGDSKSLIAQSGRVRVKVDASYGAIKPGDLLVTSPTKGHAMLSKPVKVGGQSLHRPGALLGKALEALSSGRGEILVLLTLQ